MPNPIESLREDFRAHAANDERRLATIEGDVKDLIKSQAAQTGKLDIISARLSDVLEERERKRDLEGTQETVKLSNRGRIWIAALKTIGIVLAAVATGVFTYLASH